MTDIRYKVRRVAKEHGIQTAEALWSKIKEQGGTMSMSTVQRMWGPRAKTPDYPTLRMIARAIGVTVEELEDTESGNNRPITYRHLQRV